MSPVAPTHPVEPPPTLLWTAIGVRIAWELYRARIRPSLDLVSDVREHVFLSMPAGLEINEVEARTSALLVDYLERFRKGRYQRLGAQTPPLPAVDASWRRAVEAATDPLARAVLRVHYADGTSLAEMSRVHRLSPASLTASMEGLRELARLECRQRTHAPCPTAAGWADALLARIAVAADASCPPPDQVLTVSGGLLPSSPAVDQVRRHLAGCPRCVRLVRLVRSRAIDPALLVAPSVFPPEPSNVEILAFHLHPRGREHLPALLHALGRAARPAGDDSILVDVAAAPEWVTAVTERVRLGMPAREHLRAALYRGAGRWTRRAVLGPAPVLALEASRARPWGEVDGAAALPDPLPPPPSVARWWTTAILAGLLAAVAGTWVLMPERPDPAYPLMSLVRFEGGAVDVRFDVDDRAVVNVYALEGGSVRPLLESAVPADKASLATGDGGYEAVTLEDGVIVVSLPEPVAELRDVVAAAVVGALDEEMLRTRILALEPRADVVVFRAPARGM